MELSIIILLAILGDLVLCWSVGKLFHHKGYWFFSGFALSLILTPLVMVIVGLLLPDLSATTVEAED